MKSILITNLSVIRLTQTKVVTILSKELSNRDPKKIIISSFSSKLIAQSIKVIPSYRHALIAERLPESWQDISRELNLNAWHLNADYLNLSQVRALHGEGLKVRVYTVNNRAKYEEMNEIWGRHDNVRLSRKVLRLLEYTFHDFRTIVFNYQYEGAY